MIEIEELRNYYALIEKGEYREAHEQMEDYWRFVKKESKERSLVFKGLVNGATAFVLHELGRSVYKNPWQTYLKYCENSTLEDSRSDEIYKKIKGLLKNRFEELKPI